MAILIMLNNYFHDLAVAILFCNIILTLFYTKIFAKDVSQEKLKQFTKFSLYISILSLFFILVLGVPRALYYRQYEWIEAAGRGQITSLLVKHVILGSLTFIALILQYRIYMRFCNGSKF